MSSSPRRSLRRRCGTPLFRAAVPAVLRARRDDELFLTVKGPHVDLGAQRGLGNVDRQLHDDIVVRDTERTGAAVLTARRTDAGRSTGEAMVGFARQAICVPSSTPAGTLTVMGEWPGPASGPGIRHRPLRCTSPARCSAGRLTRSGLCRIYSAGGADLACTAALGAAQGVRAWLGAAALAVLASLHPLHIDLFVNAKDRFFERQCEAHPKIGTAPRAALGLSRPGDHAHSGKQVFEDRAEVGKAARKAAGIALDARVAEAIEVVRFSALLSTS